MKKKVAIFTGNRAEYGLEFPIIRAVARHPELELYLLVSGAHLDEDFGRTIGEIARDGFEPYREVKMTMGSDTLFATAQAIGSGILSLSPILADLKPDWMVVYGDRFEALSALVTSTQMRIPTAHVEGGDLTEGGALDDSVRHAMTKLAHLHFPTNEQAAERLRRLGEEPWRIHNVGLAAIDLVMEGKYATGEELRERYGIDLDRPIVVFTQHSVTTEFENAVEQLEPSLAALERLAGEGVQIVITYPNSDAGGRAIIARLEQLARKSLPNLSIHASLGRHNYHGFLALIGQRSGGACAGNSSSGLKETPAFGCPAVDIGSRQDGRLHTTNVLRVGYDAAAIHGAIRRAIDDRAFKESCRTCDNPYGKGDTGSRVADILARTPINTDLIRKKMTF